MTFLYVPIFYMVISQKFPGSFFLTGEPVSRFNVQVAPPFDEGSAICEGNQRHHTRPTWLSPPGHVSKSYIQRTVGSTVWLQQTRKQNDFWALLAKVMFSALSQINSEEKMRNTSKCEVK